MRWVWEEAAALREPFNMPREGGGIQTFTLRYLFVECRLA